MPIGCIEFNDSMNLKKLFASFAAVAVVATSLAVAVPSVSGQEIVDAEFTSAINWMYESGMTKYNTQAWYNPYGDVSREAFAKFASTYAVSNLCLEADASASCTFAEMDMLTVMVRAINAAAGEAAPATDAETFSIARALGLTKETNIANLYNSVSRYEAALILYRSRVEDATCSDSVDITDLLEDLFGEDGEETTTDPVVDDNEEAPEGTTDVTTSSDGMLMASVSPSNMAWDTIPGNSALAVFSIDFTADDSDVVLTIDVIATIGDVVADDISNEEFQVGLIAFESNGSNDMSNLPIKGNEFEVAGVNGAYRCWSC